VPPSRNSSAPHSSTTSARSRCADQILRKPSALTDDEWVFIRQHTLVGQRILAASPTLRRIGDMRAGNGTRVWTARYRTASPGADIPLPARIHRGMRCVRRRMTAMRPYRTALTCIGNAELVRCSGSPFDPDVVAVVADSIRHRIAA